MQRPNLTKIALVRVLGCKVNQAEAAAMAAILETKGFTVDSESKEPDLVLVNTCCVTAKAEGKSRRLINRLALEYPSALLVVTGCLAEINPEVGNSAHKSLVMGTFEKDRFATFLDAHSEDESRIVRKGASSCNTYGDLGSPAIPGRSRTFLKVQDGCSQRCTYCIVPIARGPSRSMPRSAVLERAAELDRSGYSEIVLTGIHLGCYGRDLDPSITLEDLLEDLLCEPGRTRYRLSSVEPQEITQRIIDLAANNSRICRHFHVPMQSADDSVLSRMARPYDSAFIRDLTRRILSEIPEACIGLDVMVGFPGEDDRSFENTRAMIEQSGAAYLHVFPFSPRPGTPAAKFGPRVASAVAARRVEELRTLSAKLRQTFHERFLGATLTAVAESEPDPVTGTLIARTDNYIPVRVVARHAEGLFQVKLQEITSEGSLGSVSAYTNAQSKKQNRRNPS
ncbi:MAG: tRNA (N(6)-L-threonylcarbamoyladenosine(37)-C(2))-methylthiotransferase MtaB [Desulfomonile tiedjei]|uniref:tRNA (N(6)-L-threonylcarbamoyladenosine(37)-C(2))-methylthiotransferase MtaB n=1 Tax=Desulfomonile tiedjei TaxID=2358 RepID=A0A9D6V0V0_9BACT|nr:tRNA (N(6)-L-threonylcarbamoyladenosine(37)-C(2))-methylthiotransferase MtaB [Desulfomonile tiedjei]